MQVNIETDKPAAGQALGFIEFHPVRHANVPDPAPVFPVCLQAPLGSIGLRRDCTKLALVVKQKYVSIGFAES